MSNPLRILYIEDNVLVQEVTSELLAQYGREVVAFGSAEEGLEAFRVASYDLVVTDVSLPVMSGVDFARTLLRDHPMLPIIIASGYSLDFGPERLGTNVRSIIKPFGSDEIDELIAEVSKRG